MLCYVCSLLQLENPLDLNRHIEWEGACAYGAPGVVASLLPENLHHEVGATVQHQVL